MAENDLIYSVGKLFDSEPGGLLNQQKASAFRIPPYQRGYKWSSDGEDSQVQQLMSDLIGAFEANKDYYLQHLTLKLVVLPREAGQSANTKVLEVIDGQQRLTTLALLFAVMESPGEAENLTAKKLIYAAKKLIYAIREKVDKFLKDLNPIMIQNILAKDWGAFPKGEKNEFDEQDIYYMFTAIRCINKAITEKPSRNDNREKFYNFVKERVQLIVNLVDGDVQGEDIFRNLNTNRVELTNAELVKALLLTQLARAGTSGAGNPRFREVMERRAAAGRQWDEMARWINRDDVRQFYFGLPEYQRVDGPADDSIDAMEAILILAAPSEDAPKKNERNLFEWFKGKAAREKYKLFNAYEHDVTTDALPQKHFGWLKQTWMRLKDWYDDTPTYNRIGYVLHAKDYGEKLRTLGDWLSKDSKPTLDTALFKEISKLLQPPKQDDVQGTSRPEANGSPDTFGWLADLQYGEHNPLIERVLLALSVFPRSKKAEENETPFDFYRYAHEKWSLEHIFPQTPEDLRKAIGQSGITLTKNDRILIGKMMVTVFANLPGNIKETLAEKNFTEEKFNAFAKMYAESEECPLDKDQASLLVELKQFPEIFAVEGGFPVAGIGNLALLTVPDNSSNSNRIFGRKRSNIVDRVSHGSFVPKHTYDVFAKLFKGANSDLNDWTADDVKAHLKAIQGWLGQIKETLCKQEKTQ